MFKPKEQKIVDVFTDDYFTTLDQYFKDFPYVSKVDQIIYAYNNAPELILHNDNPITPLEWLNIKDDHSKLETRLEKLLKGYDCETLLCMDEMMFQNTFLNMIKMDPHFDENLGMCAVTEVPLVFKTDKKEIVNVDDLVNTDNCIYADTIVVCDGKVFLFELKYLRLTDIGNHSIGRSFGITKRELLKRRNGKNELHKYVRKEGFKYIKKWRSVSSISLDLYEEKKIKTIDQYFEKHNTKAKGKNVVTIEDQAKGYKRLLTDQYSRRPSQLNFRTKYGLKDIKKEDIKCYGVVGIVDKVVIKEFK